MLVLARNVDSAVVLGNGCVVTVAATHRGRVQLVMCWPGSEERGDRSVSCVQGRQFDAGDGVTISARQIKRGRVVLGFVAPPEMKITKAELLSGSVEKEQ